ncbi:PIN domain-containing protein [Luteococcus sp. H101]|uniref:PIN domain-containing protein n=1 Tax=Luteococcus sp. H101 TaxID=3139402 RepID=UPI00313D8859
MTAFCDTNVLVYAFDPTNEKKQETALQLLSDHRDLVISTQIMLEWFNIVTRKLRPPMLHAEAALALESFGRLRVMSTHPENVMAAAALAGSEQLSLWDAMVVEAAARAGCTTLLTEDLNAGQTIHGVTIVNPFA